MPKYQIHRDPRVFEPPPPPDPAYRLAVGLDLGTSTGVAYTWFQPGQPFVLGSSPIVLGQWDLSARDFDSGALRFARLRAFLAALDPDLIVFERVRNTPAGGDLATASRFSISAIAARITNAAQLLGAFMATVGSWAEQYNVPCAGIEIADIKRRATGKGNAGKELVIAACNETLGTDFGIEDYATTGADNIADAFWALVLGLEAYCDGVDLTPRPAGRKAESERQVASGPDEVSSTGSSRPGERSRLS